MGSPKSYVAGVIDTLEALEELIIADIPETVAHEFLKSTLVDSPRPPWQTGSLRRSGVVYIGGVKYLTTEDLNVPHLLGHNPDAPLYSAWARRRMSKKAINAGQGIEGGSYSSPQSLTLRKVKYKSTGSTGAISTLRGKITVMYQAPHAALMHEWTGNFSDPLSGAHFISSKALLATSKAAVRIKQLTAGKMSNMDNRKSYRSV